MKVYFLGTMYVGKEAENQVCGPVQLFHSICDKEEF